MKYLFGGQKHYIGRELVDVHKNLGITDEKFDEGCQYFIKSLQKIRPKPKVFRAMAQKV